MQNEAINLHINDKTIKCRKDSKGENLGKLEVDKDLSDRLLTVLSIEEK